MTQEIDQEVPPLCMLKLISGETIIGELDTDINEIDHVTSVKISLPATITLVKGPEDGETYCYLFPWMRFSESTEFEIKTKFVMISDHPNEEVVTLYNDFILDLLDHMQEREEELELKLEEEKIPDGKQLLH